jgi:glycyl-tRNA synthetase beta chain
MADVLLEIGTEEIPARFLLTAFVDMEKLAKNTLKNKNIGFDNVIAYATPRRLVTIISGVSNKQKDDVREVFGPPKQAAYDKDGNPTKAAVGFASSQGVDVKDLLVKPREGKGEYVVAVVKEKGRPVSDILPDVLKNVVLGLHFPKSMRWGDGSMRFARPIHWIAALFGDNIVEFEIDGIKSGRTTRGHRFLSSGEAEIDNADKYVSVLKDLHVVLHHVERMKIISDRTKELASGVGGEPILDDELHSILTYLVEMPVCVLGSYEKKYLELPDELLSSVMVVHQKYIPIKDPQGNLMNFFVIVSNTSKENEEMVRRGAERVLRARFEDARFYFEEDSKAKLIDRLEGLKNVTFQEKLGTAYEKTMRVKAVAGAVADLICPDKKPAVERAAELSKCDLITGVVREFPELQGIMGMYYAMEDEDDEVSLAIKDQYRPAFAGDDVPQSDVAAVLGLADRIDSIASFFSIGLKPTGSEDPFALRRQAIGVVSILIEREFDLTIEGLLRISLSNLAHLEGVADAEEEMLDFFRQRIEFVLKINKQFVPDLIQSVISFSTNVPLKDILMRLDSLGKFKSDTAYNDFLLAIKRARNIVPDRELPPLNKDLFRAAEEKELFDVTATSSAAISTFIERSDYTSALEKAVVLTRPINSFFDKVLVMDEDKAVRNNRLKLLDVSSGAAYSIADFSKLDEV